MSAVGQSTSRSTRTVVWGGVAEAIIQLVISFGVELSTEQHVALLGLLTFVVNFIAVQIEQRTGTAILRSPQSEPTKVPVATKGHAVPTAGGDAENLVETTEPVQETDVAVAEDLDPATFDHGASPALDDDLTHLLPEEEPVDGDDMTVGDVLVGERGAVDTRTLAVIATVLAVIALAVILL